MTTYFFEIDDKGRSAGFTFKELTFADHTTTTGWEEKLDAATGAREAQLFGSRTERVDEEREVKIRCGKADHGGQVGANNADLLG